MLLCAVKSACTVPMPSCGVVVHSMNYRRTIFLPLLGGARIPSASSSSCVADHCEHRRIGSDRTAVNSAFTEPELELNQKKRIAFTGSRQRS